MMITCGDGDAGGGGGGSGDGGEKMTVLVTVTIGEPVRVRRDQVLPRSIFQESKKV